MSEIILSAGVRQNLLSLQDTAALMSKTQNRLATGKKVNTALDNPSNYFTSQGLSNRASDLNALLDAIGQAQQTLKAADTGLTGLTNLVQSAKAVANQAQQASVGGVNYTNITGSVQIALDSTKASTATNVSTVGTASTQATATFLAAGFGQLSNGDTLTYKLGSGATVTATFGVATNTTTNTFADQAGLIAVLNTGTGASGNLGTTATAASNGLGGVTVTSADVTQDFVLGGTHASLSGANFSAVAHSLGDALTISDGTHTNTFYRVAAGANAANGTYTDATSLAAAIASGTNTIHAFITGTPNGTGIDLTAANNVGVTVSGNMGTTALGFAATQYLNNFNTTLNGLSGSVSVTVGTDPADVLTFGSANGQISLKSQLDAALASFNNIKGSTNSSRYINLAPISSYDVSIAGSSAPLLAALGLTAGTNTPVATVVTPSTTRANLQAQYNGLLAQIDQLAKDSSYNGVNLLFGDNLKVTFNENGTSSMTINAVKFDSAGLGLTAISGPGFQDNANIATTISSLEAALTAVRAQASAFGSTLTTVQTRNDFTKNLINVLQTGSDNLVLADTNEEGANLLALQTRQSLSTTALSLANQANQAVLRLFS
jgi:flagellin-like hook-associated protein FlgL